MDSADSSKLKAKLSQVQSEPLLKKPLTSLAKFEHIYKEIFEDLQPLSGLVLNKQRQFADSVLNVKKEIYPEYGVSEQASHTLIVKHTGDSQCSSKLPNKKRKVDSIRIG